MCSCIVKCLLKQTYVLTRDKVRNMWEDRTHKVFHLGGRSGCLTRTGRGEEEYPLLQKKGKDLGQWLLEAMVQFLSMLLWLVTHVPVPQGCQYTGLSVACVEHFSVSLLIFYMTTLPFFWLTLYCAGSKFGHSLFSRILLRRIWSRSTHCHCILPSASHPHVLFALHMHPFRGEVVARGLLWFCLLGWLPSSASRWSSRRPIKRSAGDNPIMVWGAAR